MVAKECPSVGCGTLEVIAGVSTHGNEFGLSELPQRAPKGTEVWVMHPEAAAAGVRSMGNTELMALYRPEILACPDLANIDQLTAAENYKRMKERGIINNPHALFTDWHNNVGGREYCEVGPRTLAAGLVALYELSRLYARPFNRVMIGNGPFYRAVPNSLVFELSVRHRFERERALRCAAGVLGWLSKQHPAELSSRYEAIAGQLQIYQKHEISSEVPYLEELEAMKVEKGPFPRLDPNALPEQLRQATGWNFDEGPVRARTWAQDNNGRKDPRLGFTADGKPRRQCFGVLMQQVRPLVRVDEHWVERRS